MRLSHLPLLALARPLFLLLGAYLLIDVLLPAILAAQATISS